MYIVLLGPPGSGKGTQAKNLSKEYNIGHMSTGDLIRDILKKPDHPLYEKLQVANEGKLVSDKAVNQVVQDGLTNPKFNQGAIFDGYPRTSAQAQALDGALTSVGNKVDMVIDLNVTKDVLLYRLLGRRVCPSCRRVFHIEQGIKVCPDCDVELIQRTDDNEETINKRFAEYNNKTASVRDYYENNNTIYIDMKVDDKTKTSQDIWGELKELLERANVK